MLDNVFWATIGLIFLATIVGAFIRLRQRDGCLELFDGHQVTLSRVDGRSVWGRIDTHAQGVEIIYGAPHRTVRGLLKAGYLLYQQEMGTILALCRYTGELDAAARTEREAQLARRIDPAPARRALRVLRNAFNTIRDAFSRALTALVGQIARASGSPALAAQQKELDQVGQTLLQAAGNAYEPMLEKHIGGPVILELADPRDAAGRRTELYGHLAAYTEHFVAIFNPTHEVIEELTLPGAATEGDLPPGVRYEATDQHVVIANDSDTPLVVHALVDGDGAEHRIGATLVRSAQVRLPRPPGDFRFTLRRVRHIDVICPRQHGVIRYASLDEPPTPAPRAPLPPAHFDQRAGFP